MKKLVWIVAPAFALAVFLFLIPDMAAGSPQIPVSSDQVSSISLYYANAGHKKEVTGQKDVSIILNAIGASASHGAYTRIPAGGQSFQILLHLNDGSQYACIYYQTAEASGFYSDKAGRIRLSSLDFSAIWENLSYPVIPAYAEQEFSDWPSL